MDKIPVSITTRTVQYAGGDSQVIETSARGTLEAGDGDAVIQYADADNPGIHTRLLVMPPRVDLLRSGTVSLHIEFREGESFATVYRTPQGALSLNVITRQLRVERHDGGGMDIFANYELTSLNRRLARNELSISVKPL